MDKLQGINVKKFTLAGCCAALFATGVLANPENPNESSEPPLDEVVVNGENPGPGLWKVTRQAADGEHVLWLFGTLPVVPPDVTWKSAQVEKICAQSQEIIAPEELNLSFDGSVGIFRAISLIPSVLRARKIPDDGKLKDVLPADVYQHWQAQKAAYIGSDGGIESWRPFFVADKLKDEAIRKLFLESQPSPGKGHAPFGVDVWSVIYPIAKEHNITITRPMVAAKMQPKELRASIKSFSKHSLNDVECLDKTMAVVDAMADKPALESRAMAWARGNLVALREMPSFPDADPSCDAAIVQAQVVQDFHFEGFDNLAATRAQKWLEAVENALVHNRSTLALLPIDELLKQDGRLTALRDKGYRVEDPI
jgi:TraB/PrgY/gumN family